MPKQLDEYIIEKLLKAAKRKTLTGKINDLIDLIFHPFFQRTNGLAEVLDFLAHSINEGKLDLDKFFMYNFESFLKSLVSPRGHSRKMKSSFRVVKCGRKGRTKKRTR